MDNILPTNPNVKRINSPPTFPESSKDFKKAFSQSGQIAHILEREGFKKAADSIRECHSKRTGHRCEEGHFITTRVYTCKHPLCPKCAITRMHDRITEIEPYLLRAIHEGHRVFFFTCSIPNEKNLPSVLQKTKRGFSRLINSPWWKQKIIGGVYQIETTENPKDNTWHPHVHGIAIYEKGCWINQPEFVERWLKVTGNGRAFYVKRINPQTAHKSLREVFRYTVKPSEIRVERFLELWKGIRKKRLFSRFGVLNKNHRDFQLMVKAKVKAGICPICEKKFIATLDCVYRPDLGAWEVKSIVPYSPDSEISSLGTSKAKRKTAFAFP